MQAAAFTARQGAVDDQRGDFHQIAQFEQVGCDAEVGVVLVDFFLQQAMRCCARSSRLVVRTMPT